MSTVCPSRHMTECPRCGKRHDGSSVLLRRTFDPSGFRCDELGCSWSCELSEAQMLAGQYGVNLDRLHRLMWGAATGGFDDKR